jgi:hypothetical protein
VNGRTEEETGMQQSNVGQRIACGAVGTAVAVCGAVVGLTAPAYAGGPTASHRETGAYDASRTKYVTARCLDGEHVVGAGGQINDGRGAVILTHVVPDPTLSFVSVAGTAEAGYLGKWSITAIAVCAESARAPERVIASAESPTATAECSGTGRLSGTGFRLDDPADSSYLTELVVDATMRRVRAGAGGTFRSQAMVTAIGICLVPQGPGGSPDNPVAFDGTWPKTATVPKDPSHHQVYGVGGRVEGPSDVFLDGLVPDPESGQASVHAVRAGGQTSANGTARVAGVARGATGNEDGGSVTATVISGTFY